MKVLPVWSDFPHSDVTHIFSMNMNMMMMMLMMMIVDTKSGLPPWEGTPFLDEDQASLEGFKQGYLSEGFVSSITINLHLVHDKQQLSNIQYTLEIGIDNNNSQYVWMYFLLIVSAGWV